MNTLTRLIRKPGGGGRETLGQDARGEHREKKKDPYRINHLLDGCRKSWFSTSMACWRAKFTEHHRTAPTSATLVARSWREPWNLGNVAIIRRFCPRERECWLLNVHGVEKVIITSVG